MPAPINKAHREQRIIDALNGASTRNDIQVATGMTEWQVKTALKHLIADGSIVATGESSERKYHRASIQT